MLGQFFRIRARRDEYEVYSGSRDWGAQIIQIGFVFNTLKSHSIQNGPSEQTKIDDFHNPLLEPVKLGN